MAKERRCVFGWLFLSKAYYLREEKRRAEVEQPKLKNKNTTLKARK